MYTWIMISDILIWAMQAKGFLTERVWLRFTLMLTIQIWAVLPDLLLLTQPLQYC